MSEIYQNSMDDFFAYQKKLADTIAEYIPQMDINANMSKMVEYQEKVINGINDDEPKARGCCGATH